MKEGGEGGGCYQGDVRGCEYIGVNFFTIIIIIII